MLANQSSMKGSDRLRRRRSSATDDSFDSEEELEVRPLHPRPSLSQLSSKPGQLTTVRFTPKTTPSEEAHDWPSAPESQDISLVPTSAAVSFPAVSDEEAFSLPLPPQGYSWRCFADGTGYLEPEQSSTDELDRPVVIEHVVMPEDTLLGISLRYRVRVLDLRRLNLLSSDSIFHLKVIRVPVKANTIVQLQRCTKDVKIQKFQNATGEGFIEANIYLEENDFDYQKGNRNFPPTVSIDLDESAFAMWRSDEDWDRIRALATRKKQEVFSESERLRETVVTSRTPLLSGWDSSLRRRPSSRKSS